MESQWISGGREFALTFTSFEQLSLYIAIRNPLILACRLHYG
jgi:hypothetical protein